MTNNTLTSAYITDIKNILADARQNAYRAVQSEMVSAYWRIGERIVQEEQQDAARAQYGKGFSTRSLREMWQLYSYFQNIEIWKTPFSKLSWPHFQRAFKILRFSPPHPSLASGGECHTERLCHP